MYRRNGSRALQESEDVAEEPAPDVEEDAPGPSSRQRASRRQRGASAEIELQDAQVLQEEAEATAKGSKKGKRKEKKAAKKKAAGASNIRHINGAIDCRWGRCLPSLEGSLTRSGRV